MLPSILEGSQGALEKLTDVSCVKASRLEMFPVVVEQEGMSVNMENFHGTLLCCLEATPTNMTQTIVLCRLV